MTTIKLHEFGSILTGRSFGKDVAHELLDKYKAPVEIDLFGVESLGSSFGDEVFPLLAERQQNRISVKNANKAISSILKNVALDANIEISFM